MLKKRKLNNHQEPHPENFVFPEKNKKRIINDNDLWAISYYRSSELAGSLLMGRMARQVRDGELRARLTWHFAEEARHAWRWTEVIRRLGADPLLITETYQSNYFSEVGIPKNDLELLAITQVFEKRVAYHFSLHRKRENTHPLIKEMLGNMCCDEGPHIRWIREKLDEMAKSGKADEVTKKLKKFEAIDKKVYVKEAQKFIAHGWEITDEIAKEMGYYDQCEAGCLHHHS